MTKIVLEIDTRLFLDLAERLKVKFKFDDVSKTNNLIDERKRQN